MADDASFSSLAAPSTRTLSEWVADEVRRAILTNQLKPGQRIVEREIADAVQTSRGPVRDGLKLLENEGLVIRYPHRGTFVARLTRRDAEEIYTLRLALETLATDYAVKNASSDELDRLDEIIDRISAQVQDEYTPLASTDLDLDFHRTLCQVSGHERVLQAWEGMSGQIHLLVLHHRRVRPERWGQVGVEWHRQIVDALRRRDTALARDVLHKHLITTLEIVLESFPEPAESAA
jgi:DNA-binding GntR family transcriptional regulator